MRDIIENKEIKVNEKNIIPLAEVKEESDVTLNLELYKNNTPFDVTGQSIKLGLLINSELIGEQTDGITINKNVVTIKLKNSFIQPGKLELDLTLTDNTGRMTTSSFYLIVNKKTIGGTSIQGTDLLETLDRVILNFKINSQKAIDGFIAESTEFLSEIKRDGEKTINDIKSNYDSLKQIIIDENQAANLQEQINSNKNKIEQLEDLTPVWQKETFQISKTIENTFEGIIKNFLIKGKTLDDLTSVSEEEGSVKIKSVGENSAYNYSIDVILPFEGGLKSLPNGITDEIYDNGIVIQKIEKRAYEIGDELLPNIITDRINTIIELNEHKIYNINPFFLKSFDKITHLYQENNVCGKISFEIAKDRNSIISGNTEAVSKLSEVLNTHENFINNQKDKNQLVSSDISDIKETIGGLTETDVSHQSEIKKLELNKANNSEVLKKDGTIKMEGDLLPQSSISLGNPNNAWENAWIGTNLKAKSGYTSLPNGLILQWKEDGVTHSGASYRNTIAFPITFPNGVLATWGNVTSSGSNAGGINISVSAGTRSNAIVSLYNITSSTLNERFIIFALGY